MLCAAAVVAVLVSSCRAPASDAGRYQWVIVPQGEDRPVKVYVIDTVIGEVADWDQSRKKWSASHEAPLSTPDWNDIRKQRERIKQWADHDKKLQEEARVKQEEARVKREALLKTLSQMPLEKQVAWAKSIGIYKVAIRDFPKVNLFRFEGGSNITLTQYETLTVERGSPEKSIFPYKATDDGLVVWFSGREEGIPLPLEFGLSRTPMEKDHIFSAPVTLIDDVKAEIKRQEEKKKAHAENH